MLPQDPSSLYPHNKNERNILILWVIFLIETNYDVLITLEKLPNNGLLGMLKLSFYILIQ